MLLPFCGLFRSIKTGVVLIQAIGKCLKSTDLSTQKAALLSGISLFKSFRVCQQSKLQSKKVDTKTVPQFAELQVEMMTKEILGAVTGRLRANRSGGDDVTALTVQAISQFPVHLALWDSVNWPSLEKSVQCVISVLSGQPLLPLEVHMPLCGFLVRTFQNTTTNSHDATQERLRLSILDVFSFSLELRFNV